MVEQEYADLYPLTSDILSEYLPGLDCRDCGLLSCVAFAEALMKERTESVQCPELEPGTASLIDVLLGFDIPLLPFNVMMESVSPGLVSIGHPDSDSPVMLTCNFRETVQLIEKIIEKTGLSGYLLTSDTKGYSVDNAVEEKRFTPFEVLKVITETGVATLVSHNNLIIPGLTRHLSSPIRTTTGWQTVVGPVSGFELPLFLAREGFVSIGKSD